MLLYGLPEWLSHTPEIRVKRTNIPQITVFEVKIFTLLSLILFEYLPQAYNIKGEM